MVGFCRLDVVRAMDRVAGDRADVRARPLSASDFRRGERNGGATGGAVEILSMLSWTIYSSFLGVAVLMLVPRDQARAARVIGLLTALCGLAFAFAGTLR